MDMDERIWVRGMEERGVVKWLVGVRGLESERGLQGHRRGSV